MSKDSIRPGIAPDFFKTSAGIKVANEAMNSETVGMMAVTIEKGRCSNVKNVTQVVHDSMHGELCGKEAEVYILISSPRKAVRPLCHSCYVNMAFVGTLISRAEALVFLTMEQ